MSKIESNLQNIASERAVLAGLFQHGQESLIEVELFVGEDSFTLDANKVLYKCISHALKDKETAGYADILSSAKSLDLDEYVERNDILKHISGIMNTPIHIDNVGEHAKKLKKLEFARKVQSELRTIYSDLNKVTGDESINEILSVAESPIQNICLSYIKEDEMTPQLIGDDIDAYLDHLQDNTGKSIGITTGLSEFDKAIGGGLRRKCVDLIAARPKALRHGSLVYTPDGPVNIENIEVGDIVLHPTRGSTTVTHIWPHENIDIYRIHFKDGDTVDCCQDHIWHVYKTYGKKKEELKTTKELLCDMTYGKNNKYKWNVPLPKKVEFNERAVSIDPYVMGILLGDGSVSNNTCVYHTMDKEIHDYMVTYANSLGLDVKIDNKQEGNKATSYRINGFQDKLRETGIFGHNCYNKFIPKEYIYNTVEVRLSVLAGLLDTDGDCTIDSRSGNSRTRFGSVSLQLCSDVKEIVQSLGGICSINKTQTACNGKVFDSYRCEVRLPEGVNPFRLSRKAEKFTGRKIGELKRTIVKIEKICKDNARCLTLSDNDGLFMTDNYVVTHNTGKSVFADNVALHVTKTHNIPVLMLDTEMSKEDHINRLLANLSETEINEIASGNFFNDDHKKDKVSQVAKVIKEIPYDYISIAGRPFEETLSIAKRWLIKKVGYDENGVLNDCLIIYDYLKLMTSNSINNNLAEFQVLGFQITSLHNFCVENDCPCLSFVQLNRDGITKESTDVVSGSDRLVWLCTSFSIFKDKTEEERLTDGITCGNKKLIPIVSRHGPGIEDEGYICLQMDGQYAKIRELGTIRSIKRNEHGNQQGFSDQADIDTEGQADEEDF